LLSSLSELFFFFWIIAVKLRQMVPSSFMWF
jgi:hypothetical protein